MSAVKHLEDSARSIVSDIAEGNSKRFRPGVSRIEHEHDYEHDYEHEHQHEQERDGAPV